MTNEINLPGFIDQEDKWNTLHLKLLNQRMLVIPAQES